MLILKIVLNFLITIHVYFVLGRKCKCVNYLKYVEFLACFALKIDLQQRKKKKILFRILNGFLNV